MIVAATLPSGKSGAGAVTSGGAAGGVVTTTTKRETPMSDPGRRSHGRRTVPHTADLRIEAWGRSREECVAEAVRAVVDSFADVSGAPRGREVSRRLAAGSDADLVAAAVEEVIYGLDADGEVPAAVSARRGADGGVELTLRVVDVRAVELTGAVPKAASLSGLRCAPETPGRWSCAVTVDV